MSFKLTHSLIPKLTPEQREAGLVLAGGKGHPDLMRRIYHKEQKVEVTGWGGGKVETFGPLSQA